MQALHNIFTTLTFIGFVQGIIVIAGLFIKYKREKQIYILLLMLLVTAMTISWAISNRETLSTIS